MQIQIKLEQAIAILTATAIAIILGNAIVTMFFATLGNTPTSKNWNYVITLYLFLASAGISGYLSISKIVSSVRIQKILLLAATILSGALIGFYYGGVISGKNAQIAIISAITTGLIFSCLLLFMQRTFLLAATVATLETTYGIALGMGIASIQAIAVKNWVTSFIYGLTCCGYLFFTLKILLHGIPEAVDKAIAKR